MYPHERSLVERFAGKRFALVGINSDRDKEALKARLQEEGITWRSFWDGPDGPIAKTWNVQAWPTIYMVDVEGKIRFKRHLQDEQTLDKWIAALLIEAGETPAEEEDE
jgi:hypothetical protein